MSDTKEQAQMEKFKKWATENLGEKTGIWYAPYLEQLGHFLELFELGSGYKENFFTYTDYQEFANSEAK